MKSLHDCIYTDRLILNPPHTTQVEHLLSFYRQNKEFHAPFEPLKDDSFYTDRSIQDLLAKQIHEQNDKRCLCLYLCLPESDDIIGTIGLTNIVYGAFHSAFVGYRLGHAYLHKGYMREALQTVMEIGMHDYHLHRFEANIMPGNHASIHLVESLGFRHEGYSPEYLQIAGIWEGHNHYAYINQEWTQ